MTKIAFIDLEASGLGSLSWPIEVGWCFEETGPEAYLIKPSPDWPHSAWDVEAEALHGVSMAMLEKSGRPIRDICLHLNETLADADVFSDAPDWDGYWLHRLFTAGNVKQKFFLHDFGELLGGVSKADIAVLIKKATEIAPHRHRAKDDVLHMKTIYNLARGC